MGGIDGSSGSVAVFGVLPNAAGRVDSSLEGDCGDQRGDDEKNVSGVAGFVSLFVILEALEPSP